MVPSSVAFGGVGHDQVAWAEVADDDVLAVKEVNDLQDVEYQGEAILRSGGRDLLQCLR